MFSNLSSSSISLATDTPSLVMRGAPNDLSRMTLRPLGPSVTLTASARILTPRSILLRASVSNLTSLAAMSRFPSSGMFQVNARFAQASAQHPAISGQLAQNIAFLHDQQLFAVDRDFGAG